MAAVLACGKGAVVSHGNAAGLWRLLDAKAGVVDISVPSTGGRKRRAGIRLHRRTTLLPGSVTERHRIPVTTPAQTIADLRRIVPPDELRRAIRQAEVRGWRTGLEAKERTRSELEHLFLRLCERQGLPAPEVNVRIGPRIVDFLWREQRRRRDRRLSLPPRLAGLRGRPRPRPRSPHPRLQHRPPHLPPGHRNPGANRLSRRRRPAETKSPTSLTQFTYPKRMRAGSGYPSERFAPLADKPSRTALSDPASQASEEGYPDPAP